METALLSRSKTLLHSIVLQNKLPNGLILYSHCESHRNTIAKYFTQAVFCEKFKTLNKPCKNCITCNQIEANDFVDLRIITPEKSIKIDTVREIIEDCKYGSNTFEHLVVIIENAHLFTQEAANAFLKTLEEPPKNTHFIICCPSPKTLLNTIRSRCHSLDLPLNVDPEPIENWPNYNYIISLTPTKRLLEATPLSKDKKILVKGLTIWLDQAIQSKNIHHIKSIKSTIECLQYNVNCRLQLEQMLLDF